MCRCRSATTTSHYSFGGLRIAVKRGSALYHLHGDHLVSTSLTTAGSAVEASRAYYAYGSERSASGDLQTDRTFTGQKRDATGLLYYNARYYDPALGTFISPDSMVPNPIRQIDYNRFLYARGNPIRYADPSGHCPKPPDEWGPTICLALFIEPDEVAVIAVGPVRVVVVKGDGRGFSHNSPPEQSRGYIWISLDSDREESHMNPSSYRHPWGWKEFDASADSTWEVTRWKYEQKQVIFVSYHVVLSGPLEWIGTSPHIDGYIGFVVDNDGNVEASFYRDGFPWAEANLSDGEGNVETIFRDPAVRADPFDLFSIEEMTLAKRFSQTAMAAMDGDRETPIVSQQPGSGGGYNSIVPTLQNRPLLI